MDVLAGCIDIGDDLVDRGIAVGCDASAVAARGIETS